MTHFIFRRTSRDIKFGFVIGRFGPVHGTEDVMFESASVDSLVVQFIGPERSAETVYICSFNVYNILT